MTMVAGDLKSAPWWREPIEEHAIGIVSDHQGAIFGGLVAPVITYSRSTDILGLQGA
jgi:hypothetical protein